jgi:redox-sensing transcriptional repressor
MNKNRIPDIIVGRLPIYLRALQRMLQEGKNITSSQELGERVGITAAQIRKDLSQFGEFGKQGTGYHIEFLVQQIEEILNVNHEWEIVVVGAGDIGNAVARYRGFNNRGFCVKMIFDNHKEKIHTTIDAFTIQDSNQMVEMIQQSQLKIAMICVPAEEAQHVADQLVKAGIKAILNYAPINISVPKDVLVQYIDPSVHLQYMTYYLE